MIRYVKGNLFESGAEALVNTVNCVGIMGKGIAYQFRRAYPLMFTDYQARCRRGEIRLGEVAEFTENGKVIVNFPTKDHWRANSRLEDIYAGLRALKVLIDQKGISSIALPPLGCGNGGLSWPDVKEAIDRELGDCSAEIEVYEPAGDFQSKTAQEPRVTLSHYILVAIRLRLKKPGRLNIHKAAYFYNVFSGTKYFQFTDYKFGPYCIAIEPMIKTITDFLDFRRMKAEEMLADGLARRLAGDDVVRLERSMEIIGRATDLANEENHQLEALATVHALLAKNGHLNEDRLITAFYSWSKEKERFSRADIVGAADCLTARGLIAKTLLGYESLEPRSPENFGKAHRRSSVKHQVQQY